jgi:hypothetical protein
MTPIQIDTPVVKSRPYRNLATDYPKWIAVVAGVALIAVGVAIFNFGNFSHVPFEGRWVAPQAFAPTNPGSPSPIR